MTLNSVFQFLVPKDKKFFPLFEEASSNLIELIVIKSEWSTIDLAYLINILPKSDCSTERIALIP